MFSEQDYTYMAKAIQLASTPIFSPHPNPRVGCVIVKADRVIGQGFHAYSGGPHAEVNALNNATDSVKGATVYVTLEPCSHHGKTPPCADALINADVKRVVIAMLDPNPVVSGNGVARLKEAGIEVVSGLLLQQSEQLNRGFIKRMKVGMPWVRTKIAMSIDGRTAMANGESQWITGSEARHDVQRLRAQSDAILTGTGTVLADNPRMNVRDIEDCTGKFRQPLRIVIDGQLKSDAKAAIFNQSGESWIATLSDVGAQQFPDNVIVKSYSEKSEHVDLTEVLTDLAANEINEVHVEAGAVLNGVLLAENLIDELVVYMAPTIMGDMARGLFHLPQLNEMKDRLYFTTTDVRCVGNDIRLSFKPNYNPSEILNNCGTQDKCLQE